MASLTSKATTCLIIMFVALMASDFIDFYKKHNYEHTTQKKKIYDACITRDLYNFEPTKCYDAYRIVLSNPIILAFESTISLNKHIKAIGYCLGKIIWRLEIIGRDYYFFE